MDYCVRGDRIMSGTLLKQEHELLHPEILNFAVILSTNIQQSATQTVGIPTTAKKT